MKKEKKTMISWLKYEKSDGHLMGHHLIRMLGPDMLEKCSREVGDYFRLDLATTARNVDERMNK